MASASPVAASAIDALLRALATGSERPGVRASNAAPANPAGTTAASQGAAATEAGSAVRITGLARLAALLEATPVTMRLAGQAPLASTAGDTAMLAAGLRTALAPALGEGHAEGEDRGPQSETRNGGHARPAASPVARQASVPNEVLPGLRPGDESAPAAPDDAAPAPVSRLAHDGETPTSLVTRGADPMAPPVPLHVVWEGETWPGQRATLTVEREHAEREGAEAPRAWRTTLVADLPALGAIRAELTVSGTRVNVALVTPDGDARTQLDAERGRLLAALAQAGFAAGRIEVRG